MVETSDRTYRIGPNDGSLLVRTARDGLAARVGHDLVIEMARWAATLTIPDGVGDRSHVAATIDALSLEVREGAGGAMPLSEKDVADIRKNALESLQAGSHPDLTFESTAIEPVADGRYSVAGDLTIAGVTRPIRFVADVDESEGVAHVTATAPILQSDWGIKPYRAFMGALKVRDQVDVAIDIRARR
jgi:polyisoprenoid-binding protein YceI